MLQGRRLTRVEARRADLRRAFPPDLRQRLTGVSVTGLARRAKYGLIDTDRSDTLIFHLGMSGKWRIDPAGLDPHDHFLLETDEGRPPAQRPASLRSSIWSAPRHWAITTLPAQWYPSARRYFRADICCALSGRSARSGDDARSANRSPSRKSSLRGAPMARSPTPGGGGSRSTDSPLAAATLQCCSRRSGGRLEPARLCPPAANSAILESVAVPRPGMGIVRLRRSDSPAQRLGPFDLPVSSLPAQLS